MQGNQSLAQQAMQIHDELGETALNYFVYHTRARISEDTLWRHQCTEPLYDHSMVTLATDARHNRSYVFAWFNQTGEIQIAHRPASHKDAPPPPEPSQHLMQWPSTEDIQKHALERAMAEAAKINDPNADANNQPLHNFSPHDLAVMDMLAPELRKAANHEILNEMCPQNAIDVLASYLDDYANDAIARVPIEQWEALVQHLAQRQAKQPAA